jgi:hypothetical protein
MQGEGSATAEVETTVERHQVVDAVVAASRALVAVAARSLAGLEEEVTLTQLRVLVLLYVRTHVEGEDANCPPRQFNLDGPGRTG